MIYLCLYRCFSQQLADESSSTMTHHFYLPTNEIQIVPLWAEYSAAEIITEFLATVDFCELCISIKSELCHSRDSNRGRQTHTGSWVDTNTLSVSVTLRSGGTWNLNFIALMFQCSDTFCQRVEQWRRLLLLVHSHMSTNQIETGSVSVSVWVCVILHHSSQQHSERKYRDLSVLNFNTWHVWISLHIHTHTWEHEIQSETEMEWASCASWEVRAPPEAPQSSFTLMCDWHRGYMLTLQTAWRQSLCCVTSWNSQMSEQDWCLTQHSVYCSLMWAEDVWSAVLLIWYVLFK